MEWNITNIEAITEDEAVRLAMETMEIKGHDIYFVDFGGYFKYSMLVFLNGKHIYYANDYQLHHEWLIKEKGEWEGRKELRKRYIEKANKSLFTEEEFGKPLKNYDEYEKKSYYLHNYYALQTERESAFMICPTDKEKKEFERKVKGWTYDPIGFCYIPDKAFVEKHVELYKELNKAKENVKDNYEYYKSAFLYEMYNHEYGINWQADYDVLSAFGRVEWHGESENALEMYFNDLEFTETQRKAYRAARSQYYANEREAM